MTHFHGSDGCQESKCCHGTLMGAICPWGSRTSVLFMEAHDRASSGGSWADQLLTRNNLRVAIVSISGAMPSPAEQNISSTAGTAAVVQVRQRTRRMFHKPPTGYFSASKEQKTEKKKTKKQKNSLGGWQRRKSWEAKQTKKVQRTWGKIRKYKKAKRGQKANNAATSIIIPPIIYSSQCRRHYNKRSSSMFVQQ